MQVTPKHCSCVGLNCTLISGLRNFSDVVHDHFDERCTAANYVSTYIDGEMLLVINSFVRSAEFTATAGKGQLTFVTCEQWRDRYIAPHSVAYDQVC